MFDFIPLPYYTLVFYNTILLLVLFVFFKLFTKSYHIYNHSSLLLLLASILYIGLRPVSVKYFGDMEAYNIRFISYAKGSAIDLNKDLYWLKFMKFLSGFISSTTFFVVCAALYILTLYKSCKKWFGNNMYIPFLMHIASFSFWSYTTNGIRNGIATSLFIYALSREKKLVKYFVFFLAFSVHGSIALPIFAFILTTLYNQTKYFLLAWLAAIPLSIGLGSFWESFFMALGYGGERLSYLTDDRFSHQFASTEFRWDFLIYSAFAVFVGSYFIIKKNYQDKHYHQIFNIYLAANAFWILIIRTSFSNRFAYLSWFLMAVVIFYPFFKQQFFKNQRKILACIVLGYFGFSYLMFLIK